MDFKRHHYPNLRSGATRGTPSTIRGANWKLGYTPITKRFAPWLDSWDTHFGVMSGLATINPERLGRPLGRLSSSRLADESVMMQVTRLHNISRMTEEIIFR